MNTLKCAETSNVIVSSLVQRSDGFNNKVKQVNETLKSLCEQRNIGYIDNLNIDPTSHLNRSKLHLNRTGTRILQENFGFAFKN